MVVFFYIILYTYYEVIYFCDIFLHTYLSLSVVKQNIRQLRIEHEGLCNLIAVQVKDIPDDQHMIVREIENEIEKLLMNLLKQEEMKTEV